MQREQAVEKAMAAARDKDWDLDDYDEPTANLASGTWTVRFEGRKRAPGNHFIVQVDDSSGDVVLWPGR
jgi:hypothetical protein